MAEPNPWDPDRYLTFADERGRPFVELIGRIGATAPATVVDLGCGPGNLTSLLTRRWPAAEVTGLDSSPSMIERARQASPGLRWELADLRAWGGTADVVVSNAALQWIPGHLELLPALARRARSWFAFQVPGNFDEPSHTLRMELARQQPYAAHLAAAVDPDGHRAVEYRDVLSDDGWEVDAWETTYLHELTGPDPVLAWISGTSLLPTKAALPPELFARFRTELRDALREAYPSRNGTVTMPFRRIFVVARRPQ